MSNSSWRMQDLLREINLQYSTDRLSCRRPPSIICPGLHAVSSARSTLDCLFNNLLYSYATITDSMVKHYFVEIVLLPSTPYAHRFARVFRLVHGHNDPCSLQPKTASARPPEHLLGR
jgi:hypothetical protein